MTNSQWKKQRARLFNLRRDEAMAYEIDSVLFPKPKRAATEVERLAKRKAQTWLTLAASL